MIRVEALRTRAVEQQPIEIVERKGLGHPDSICDGLAEHVAVTLAGAYQERFGRVLHYNLDKALLAAGSVEHRFGGGHLVEPMRLILGDRATLSAEGSDIPVRDIVEDAARAWFQRHLPRVDADRHVRYQLELRPSSPGAGGNLHP